MTPAEITAAILADLKDMFPEDGRNLLGERAPEFQAALRGSLTIKERM